MITIEVLISLLILFIVVTTSVIALKNALMVEKRKEKYQDLYRAIFNVQALMPDSLCIKDQYKKGKINDFDFNLSCTQISELRGYQKSFDTDTPEGNIGSVDYILYEITLTFQKEHFSKTYKYYKTVTKKLR